MKELIPMDDMGVLVAKTGEKIMVDSRLVAQTFEKPHNDLLKSIRNILSEDSGYTEEFRLGNFSQSNYINEQNHKMPMYYMTRDGFTALVMGMSGKRAAQFKEAYIKRFNEMEDKLLQIQTLRDQYPALTDAIKDMHGDDTKPYHYSNEADMLNRIAIGCTAKQFREKNGIEKSEPIRPHLDSEKSELLDYLQRVDVGLVYSMPDFQMRKQKLEWCADKWYERKGYMNGRMKIQSTTSESYGLPSCIIKGELPKK